MDVQSKLAALDAETMEGRVLPSAKLVEDFELRFSVTLSPTYRAFLAVHGGILVSAEAPLSEVTPFGQIARIDEFFGFMADPNDPSDVRWATEVSGGAPIAIPIGSDSMGFWTYLMCEGAHAGGVFLHDREGRSGWPDEWFWSRFPNLSPEVADYLERRRIGGLPSKPKALGHFYRIADCFDSFLDKCRAER